MLSAKITRGVPDKGLANRYSTAVLLLAIAGSLVASCGGADVAQPTASSSSVGGGGGGAPPPPAPPPPPPAAGTFFVATTGSDLNSCATAQNGLTPKQTIQAGFSCLSPGSTLIIRDGTYSGAANSFTGIPNGSAGNYITIRAENEGNVIITAGLDLSQGNSLGASYLVVQGLRFQDSGQKSIVGDHLKFFRNEFKGAPATGNVVSVAVGTNNFTPGAQNVLMEDNWVHGFGGRYKILVYNADHVILRRVVTRFDGYNSTDNAPEADITVYDSRNVEVQNPIAIDGVTGTLAANYVAAFYNVCNATTTTPSTNRFWRGAMAIKPSNFLMGTEGQCDTTNELAEDMVLVGGGYGVSQLKGTVQYSRVTIVGPSGDGFGIFGGSASVQDSIVVNASGKAFNNISPLTSVAFNNAGGNTGGTILNPFISGLLYPPRIEANSILSLGGTSGQRGANIVTQMGTSGTLYGDPGYNTPTAATLWPWPNQTRIKKEMCADPGVTAGFCASASLSNYIWESLGKPCPIGICN